MYTFTQRAKLLPVIFTLKILGYIDSLGHYFEYLFGGIFSVLLVAFMLNEVKPAMLISSEYLTTGITYSLYGSYSYRENTQNVLGAAIIREYPFKISETPPPGISAKAALVVDKKTNKILFTHNTEEQLAPASTTKLMTALVALDLFEMEEELKVPGLCTTVVGSRAGFREGEIVSVEDLLKALLVSSSGDAACVLATSSTSITEFVELMNEKAQEFGMTNTVFTNPIGLDGVDGSHHSTAYDLYLLSKTAMSNSFIKDMVRIKEVEINPGKIYNTNKLLWEIPNTVGIKTGTTAAAGEVLIYEYKDDIKELIIIVMGSADRFSDTRNLLNWAQKSFVWE